MLQVPFAIQSDYRNVLSIMQLWIFLQKNPSELEKFSAILSSVCVWGGVPAFWKKYYNVHSLRGVGGLYVLGILNSYI